MAGFSSAIQAEIPSSGWRPPRQAIPREKGNVRMNIQLYSQFAWMTRTSLFFPKGIQTKTLAF
jgi:hypothetical protein